jgi:hypothetical protein
MNIIKNISKKYKVTVKPMYSDFNRYEIVSPYFNTLLEINKKEFQGKGLLEKYGNLQSTYVLYSPYIFL